MTRNSSKKSSNYAACCASGITIFEDSPRKGSGSGGGSGKQSSGRAVIRLTCSDTQYPELGHETVELWEDQFEYLRGRHDANGYEPELARSRIFSMLCRYTTLEQFGMGNRPEVSVPAAVADVLAGPTFGVQHECFASPVGHRRERYCSLFSDTDMFFGSWGSFYNFEPRSGSFAVHPVIDEQALRQCCAHIVRLLRTSNCALSFVLVVPAMDRMPSISVWARPGSSSPMSPCREVGQTTERVCLLSC